MRPRDQREEATLANLRRLASGGCLKKTAGDEKGRDIQNLLGYLNSLDGCDGISISPPGKETSRKTII
jgi:hypothetical protein